MAKSDNTNKMLLYAAVAAGVYFLFFHNKGNNLQSNAMVTAPLPPPTEPMDGEGVPVEEVEEEERPGSNLQVPVAKNSLVDINISGKELLGIQDGGGSTLPQ